MIVRVAQEPNAFALAPMSMPIKLISTDFDGTLHSDFEHPPVPHLLQDLIGLLQSQGAQWVINTGRDLPSLMEGLHRARLSVRPDYVVVVEREIYQHAGGDFISLLDWNDDCTQAHAELFSVVRRDLPRLIDWVQTRFEASIYEDAYSPFCLIAQNNRDADQIHEYLSAYCEEVANLTVVRNDIYARFSHVGYNKGTALAEISRMLGIGKEHTVVAGDHLNDLPMLSQEYARWLVAPANAIDQVKTAVLKQNGYVSEYSWGHGVARGLEHVLEQHRIEAMP